ncbi:conjugal transfer protein TraI [Legionella qingyii]|uniref:Conjugal transfer protein TraI n=1 Tax=Legionella qingyii TaxID=2184757 RepID=A0A317TYI3_9GAMM|nr:MobF family relaxase [Legionella qingyii]PWY54109.1 conjugal transfer protein TraI [Legionella qingyii]PWY54473.1 conjugal transfer protein TraI [Legionella qingyii]RUR21115.1 conjugative relaxase [Legionella qingyii]
MLSIQPLKSAQGAADYYAAAFNYYAGDATAMQWLGKTSSHFQLNGVIEKEHMLALLEGRLPNGQVLQNLKGEHRPGFDMTFSAPKSVSLLVGLGAAPELVRFHDEAVKYAIGQIEREFAQTRVRRDGEICYEKTDNLLVAAFRQPNSRANDPALHTHCVTMNMTFHQGKIRSLASDPSRNHGVIEQIQNNAHYCGLIYRQHLANSLKKAGFPLRMAGDGLFEIDGIPDAVLREFSRRREDIEKHLEEKGWSGAKSASAATLLTRHGKEDQEMDVLALDWQERAKALGFDAHHFIKNRHQHIESQNWFSAIKEKLIALVKKNKQPPETGVALACVQVAIETLSQRTAVFSERTLLNEAMKHSLIYPEVITKETLITAIGQEKINQNLYEAQCPETRQTVLTTPWLLTVEAETIARIENNKRALSSIASKERLESFQRERSQILPYPMTDSQKQSMVALLTGTDRFSAIQGYAGVAKTSMLAEARMLIEERGYQLRGITVASSAAHELQTKAGISTDVFPIVHQELKKAPTASLSKTVFIVDEASMLSAHQGHELLKQVERTGARLVLVGDKAQLPSVNTGRIFSLTQEYGIETNVMDEIVRQKNQKAKDAVICATKGNVKEALEHLNVQTLGTHEERIQWIADHWLSLIPEEREKTLLFAPTHANREAITQIIREGLQSEGVLKGTSLEQKVLKAKTIEAVQQRFVAYYQKGDVIRFNQDFQKGRIKQGSYYTVGTITQAHLRDNVLPIVNEQGKAIQFALKNLPHYKTHTAPFERVIELYEAKSLELYVGDKVMWTRNFNKDGIRNGQCATIQEINDEAILFTTAEGQSLTLKQSHSALKHLDYSYVLTNYKVQGKDAPYGIGLMESYHRFSATLKNFYVQISRAVHGMTLVTDNKEELIEAIQRNSNEKPASLDVISSKQLMNHEDRFMGKAQLSIQSVIDKKILYEANQRFDQLHPKNKIEELYFTKNNSYNEKPKESIKELEL